MKIILNIIRIITMILCVIIAYYDIEYIYKSIGTEYADGLDIHAYRAAACIIFVFSLFLKHRTRHYIIISSCSYIIYSILSNAYYLYEIIRYPNKFPEFSNNYFEYEIIILIFGATLFLIIICHSLQEIINYRRK